MMLRSFFLILFLLHAPFLWAAPDVTFDPTYQTEQDQLFLQGRGVKKIFFRPVFVSSLYTPISTPVSDILSKVAKRLEVHYLIAVSKERLTRYTIKKIKDNLPYEEYQALSQELLLLHDYFVDLGAGDRFALTYIPEVGTHFEHNGLVKGVIQGDLFAKGIFAVWLGDDPMDKDLKGELLLGLEK